MITQRKISFILVIGVILSGCASFRNQAPPHDTNTPAYTLATPSRMTTPTATPGATSTQPRITSTPPPTPTAKSSVTQIIKPSGGPIIPLCAEEGQIIPLPPDFGIAGTIIYQTDDNNGLYTIGGVPLRQGKIVDEQQQVTVYGFSSDGQWLAYAPGYDTDNSEAIVFNTPAMILLSAGRERLEQAIAINGLDKELQDRCVGCQGYHFFGSFGEWINDSLMYINLGARGYDKYDTMYSELPKVFDPLTGDWQAQWFNNLPDVYAIYPTRATFHHIKLSPDLSRILYPVNTGGIILRNVIEGVEIWSDGEFSNRDGEEIVWSPDSKMVAVANLFYPKEHRLLLITRDGDVTELVNAQYPQPGFYAASLSWSPDGRYLALAVVLDDDGIFEDISEVNVYLYDAQTKSYLYRCPLPGVIGVRHANLVWSPDGQWIAYREHPLGAMRLLNVQSGEIIQLLDNAEPVGWSDKFPVVWP